MNDKLTIASVKAEFRPLGLVLRKRDGEYCVRVRHAAQEEGYYTDSLRDARDTGLVMAQNAAWDKTHSAAAVERVELAFLREQEGSRIARNKKG